MKKSIKLLFASALLFCTLQAANAQVFLTMSVFFTGSPTPLHPASNQLSLSCEANTFPGFPFNVVFNAGPVLASEPSTITGFAYNPQNGQLVYNLASFGPAFTMTTGVTTFRYDAILTDPTLPGSPFNLTTGNVVIPNGVTSGQPFPFEMGVLNYPVTVASPIISTNSPVAFGQIAVGSAGNSILKVKNTGSSLLTVSGFTFTNPIFSTTNPVTFPFDVAAGDSALISLSVVPTLNGNASGVLQIANNSSVNPHLTNLTVQGVVPQITANDVNFGQSPINQQTIASLKIKNPGGVSLTVSGFTFSSPVFATLNPVTFPFTISSGDSVEINLTCTPTTVGAISGTVQIANNSTNNPKVVTLTADAVSSQIVVNVVDFGSINVGSTGTANLKIKNDGAIALAVSGFTFSNPVFATTNPVTFPFNIASGDSVEISLSCTPTANGSLNGTLQIANNSTTNPANVSLVAQGLAPVIAAPAVSFGSILVGGNGTADLVISNTGGADLSVTGLTFSNPAFTTTSTVTFPITVVPNGSATISLTCSPTATGNLSGNVQIANNSAVNPLTVNLSAVGTAPVIVTANTLDFGNVLVGAPGSTKLLVIHNTGTGLLTVSAMNFSTSVFSSIFPTPFNVAPGDSVGIPITALFSADSSITGSVDLVNTSATSPKTVNLAANFVLSAWDGSNAIPTVFSLENNFPNPFNPTTTLRFALPEKAFTKLVVYNVLGQAIKTIVSEQLPAGYHSFKWNGTDENGKQVSSGIYFYRIVANNFVQTKKMTFLK
ncbi:choice-of-anchor D domain-containing protein [bacterium]|nr:choice-of-anchor D domain-containing protein [bacterium]